MKDRESLFSTVIHKDNFRTTFAAPDRNQVWEPTMVSQHVWGRTEQLQQTDPEVLHSVRVVLQLRGFQHTAFYFQCPQTFSSWTSATHPAQFGKVRACCVSRSCCTSTAAHALLRNVASRALKNSSGSSVLPSTKPSLAF